MNLAVGCGSQRKGDPGWMTLDANPESGADFICELPPFPEAVTRQLWNTVEMIHVLEHFYVWDAKGILKNIYELLSPSGVLVLEQPNLEFCARVLLGQAKCPGRFDPEQCSMWGFYGDPNHRDPHMIHRWGYTPDSLRQLLVECGFDGEGITQRRAKHHLRRRDFRLEVTK